MRQTTLVSPQISILELYPFAANAMPDETEADFAAYLRWRDSGEEYQPHLGVMFHWVRRQQAHAEQQKQLVKLRVQEALVARVTMMEAVNATLSNTVTRQLHAIEVAETPVELGIALKALQLTLRNIKIAQDITVAALPPVEPGNVNILQQFNEPTEQQPRPLSPRQAELERRRQLRLMDAEAAKQL